MPAFYETPQAFRGWLKRNSKTSKGIRVGFRTRPNGHPCMSVDEAVEEAMCFGWCAGKRIAIDSRTYAMAFAPRPPERRWTSGEMELAQSLLAQDRMTPAGKAAFQSRIAAKADADDEAQDFAPSMLAELKRHASAWAHFQKLPPSHQQRWIGWVMSAKQEATRSDRFARLLMDLARPKR